MLRLYILPVLGEDKLADISGTMIRKAILGLRKREAEKGGPLAMRTIKLAYAVLHRALEAAVEVGHLKVNSAPKFGKLRLGDIEGEAESAKRQALTAPQVAALLEACREDHPLRLYVAIMASSGLRPGEASGLRWQDVDGCQLHVRGATKVVYAEGSHAKRVWIGKPKTASSIRTVAIGLNLVALFAAERERQENVQRMLRGRNANVRDLRSLLPDDACVFPHDPTTPEGLRAPLDPKSLYMRFKGAATLAGLPHVSPHWLRHTAISHAIAEGTPLADASKRAGHKNPAVTAAIYTHAVSENERMAARIGDSLLGPVKGAEVERITDHKEQEGPI